MKRFIKITAIFILSSIVMACGKEADPTIEEVKQLLPGKWLIQSFNLTPNGAGTYLRGNVIYNDTVLTDVGMIEITDLSQFDGKYSPYLQYADCNYILDGESATISITRLFTNKQGTVLSFFLSSYRSGSEIANFLQTSHLWSLSYLIRIYNQDIIILTDNNQSGRQSIFLKRI